MPIRAGEGIDGKFITIRSRFLFSCFALYIFIFAAALHVAAVLCLISKMAVGRARLMFTSLQVKFTYSCFAGGGDVAE